GKQFNLLLQVYRGNQYKTEHVSQLVNALSGEPCSAPSATL
ncbi:hypothetical protein GBF38_009784, partial [Nibea albiflora]